MKKIISVILVCSMLVLGSLSVFAQDSAKDEKSFDLNELFVNYKEHTIDEMVEYVYANPAVLTFIEYFHESVVFDDEFELIIHQSGELKRSEMPQFDSEAITSNIKDYFICLSRVVVANERNSGSFRMGEMGEKCFGAWMTAEFHDYLASLDKAEADVILIDLIMNLVDGDIVGISSNCEFRIGAGFGAAVTPNVYGDCNGDGSVNAIDSNLMKKVLSGANVMVDPITVDVNRDGKLNSMDAFLLKTKLTIG